MDQDKGNPCLPLAEDLVRKRSYAVRASPDTESKGRVSGVRGSHRGSVVGPREGTARGVDLGSTRSGFAVAGRADGLESAPSLLHPRSLDDDRQSSTHTVVLVAHEEIIKMVPKRTEERERRKGIDEDGGE